MTKEWLLSVANKGPQKYAGATIEIHIWTSEVFENQQLIGGLLRAMNPFSSDMHFGGGLVVDVTDEEVSKMDEFLDNAIRRMECAKAISKAEPITMKWVDEKTLAGIPPEGHKRRRRLYGYDKYRDEHFSIYTNGGGEWDYPIETPVIIDGKLYRALYSFWLDRYVYPFNQPECFEFREGGFQE